MKNIIVYIFICLCFAACAGKDEKGKFTLNGNVKNIPSQKVFLEEMYFNEKPPLVLDTAEIKNGKFTLSAIAPEEGMYRLRFAGADMGYIFINDGNPINFTADANDSTLNGAVFNTPANNSLKTFLQRMEVDRKNYASVKTSMLALPADKITDSVKTAVSTEMKNIADGFKNYMVQFLNKTKSPVLAMFVMGYTRDIEPDSLANTVKRLQQDFPTHNGMQALLASYKVATTTPPAPPAAAATGSMAADIKMNDTAGKPFALSSLRGKYVLIDFWASWCGPCRAENPNVVLAYNSFKTKNFTVLGVSLDEDKKAWLQAIKKDKLSWMHVSELKGWETSVTSSYNFNSIPYNVLIDPQGNIIGSNLRGQELLQKLQEVLP